MLPLLWHVRCTASPTPLARDRACSHGSAPGQELRIGAVHPESGVRGYLGVSGGIDVPLYLGSRATFPNGKIGGYPGS